MCKGRGTKDGGRSGAASVWCGEIAGITRKASGMTGEGGAHQTVKTLCANSLYVL